MSTNVTGSGTAVTEPPPRRPGPSLSWLATTPRPRAIIAVFSITNVVLLLIPMGLFPYYRGTILLADVNLYSQWAAVLDAGHFPINDPMWQYPPLSGVVFWLGAHLGQNPLVGFIVLALAVNVAIFILLYRRGVRGSADGTAGMRGAWVWALGGLAVGPLLLTRFDIFPTLFAILALLALARPVRSGIWLGVGALLKIWPALLVLSLPRRALAKGAAAMVATGIAGLSAAFMYGQGSLSFLTEQRDRGLQIESVGALPYLIGEVLGQNVPHIFRYGSLEIDAPGTATVGMLVSALGLLGIAVVAYARLRGKLESVAGADVALTLVLISIVSSRVFSPQYIIWAVGVAAVCMLDPKSRMKPVAVVVLVVAVLGQLIYPLLYNSLVHGYFLGVVTQSLRIGLLILATGWALGRIFRKPVANGRG